MDNGSKGGAVAAHGRDGVKLVRLAENLGFASGVNAGVAASRGDFVALLNDDAVAGPSWLESSCKVLEEADIAAVGPRILLGESLRGGGSRRRGALRPRRRAAARAPAQLGDARRLRRLERSRRSWHTPARTELRRRAVGAGRPAGARSTSRFRRMRPQAIAGIGDRAERRANPDPACGGPREQRRPYLRAGRLRRRLRRGPSRRRSLERHAGVLRCERDGPGHHGVRAGRIGPLERSYFAYYEDTDWCWRAHLQGYRILYDAVIDRASRSRPDKRRRARCPNPVPRRAQPDPHPRSLRPGRPRGARGEAEVARGR